MVQASVAAGLTKKSASLPSLEVSECLGRICCAGDAFGDGTRVANVTTVKPAFGAFPRLVAKDLDLEAR